MPGLHEKIARALCNSKKFETGEGTCSAACLDQLGSARPNCPHAARVHRDLTLQISLALPDLLTEAEACVIEAAMELASCWEGGKYGPMQDQIKKAERILMDACSDLACECDGQWRNPY